MYGGAGLTMLIADPKGGVKFGAGKSKLYNVEARLGLDQMPDLRADQPRGTIAM